MGCSFCCPDNSPKEDLLMMLPLSHEPFQKAEFDEIPENLSEIEEDEEDKSDFQNSAIKKQLMADLQTHINPI